MTPYAKWIRDGIKKPGKSAIGLAAHLTKALRLKTPMHRGTIYKMIAGARDVRVDELRPISDYIEEPIPMLPTGELLTLPIEKQVCAGKWIEADTPSTVIPSTILTPRDFNFPDAVHHAYCFKGDSMTAYGIHDGDVLICIESEEKPTNGKLVILERTRAGLVETSVRIVQVIKDRIEFAVASNAESYKPVILRGNGKRGSENETIRVVAFVRRVVRDFD